MEIWKTKSDATWLKTRKIVSNFCFHREFLLGFLTKNCSNNIQYCMLLERFLDQEKSCWISLFDVRIPGWMLSRGIKWYRMHDDGGDKRLWEEIRDLRYLLFLPRVLAYFSFSGAITAFPMWLNFTPVLSRLIFKYEAQAALFKDPVRTAQ